MSSIVKVENVGKRYLLGGIHPGHTTLREAIGNTLLAPLGRRAHRESAGSGAQEFWALDEVSFTMETGETLGIVGRNGAGKSTLLKILSRITKPTTGRARLRGRVGSLLEVGTGFHPDLTGRENIFLNGAILGMRRAEIRLKFDEIVEFSEIEQHLDTAVKFYSSGMYVRLAFSVAAHLDPEILIMDEVLAVGDAAFQQKCLDKMQSIRREGRTIFFVSHNMAAVTRLCKRAILLHQGRIVLDGDAHTVVHEYLSANRHIASERSWTDSDAPGDHAARLRRVRVCTADGDTPTVLDAREQIGIEVVYDILATGYAPVPRIDIFNSNNLHLFGAHDTTLDARTQLDAQTAPNNERIRTVTTTAWIPPELFTDGNLLVHVSLLSFAPRSIVHARERNVIAFQVVAGARDAAEDNAEVAPTRGVIRPHLKWTTKANSR